MSVSVALVSMSDDDFKAFLRKTIPEYAHAQVQAGSWHSDEAVRRAQEEFQRILPQGPRTPRQFFYVITDAASTQKVGMLWYSVDDVHLKKKAFVADFFIFMEFRHQGYEAAALAALDATLATQDVRRVEVHLFARDREEQTMFEQAGFGCVSIYLGKDLPGGTPPQA